MAPSSTPSSRAFSGTVSGRAGVEQQAVAVGRDDRGEAPLADPLGVGQHRREDRDLERADARRHPGLTGGRPFAEESPG